ncbi:MAG: hypothetical protein ACLSH6_09385 [Limosilactobacillus pontis]
MKLNKTFYKNTDLYLGLVMMVTALAEVVMGRDPYNDVILGLFIIVGLVFIGHALLNTDATDWLISGQGPDSALTGTSTGTGISTWVGS